MHETGTQQETSIELLPSQHDEKIHPLQEPDPPIWISKRLLVSLMMFLCTMNMILLRGNMSIVIVGMTSNTTIVFENQTGTRPPEFNWDSRITGIVLSMQSYGGLFSFLGSYPVNKFGASGSCSLCMMVSSIATILHPVTLYCNLYAFLACRFVMGLFEAFTYVSIAQIFSRWFPIKERSRLISYSYSGVNIGIAVVFPFCGYIAHNWGWQMVFYVTGIIGLTLSVLCLSLISNSPSDDKWISKKELLHILEGTATPKRKVTHPYGKILTSGPFWALCVSKFVYAWIVFNMFGACFPLFLKDMTGKNTKEIGFLASIPNTVFIFMFPVAGTLMDFWKNSSEISITLMHKIIMGASCFLAAGFFVATVYISNFTASLVFFVLIQMMLSFVSLIIQFVTVSIAPNNSSAIAGLASIFLAVSSVISRTATGYMTTNHSLEEWNNCFILSSTMAAVGGVMFLWLGSSEPQAWS